MECVNPEAIEGWELQAYSAGDAREEVAAHLDICPACRAEVVAMQQVERRLRDVLSRVDCPQPEELRDFYWADLGSEERARVQEHLDHCPHCALELAELARIGERQPEGTSPGLWERVGQAAERTRTAIAQLVSPGGASMVPVLRGETREVLLFEAGPIPLSLNLEQEETGNYTLFGQVLSPERPVASDSYARVTGQDSETLPAEAPLDENGGFAIPDLPPGTYTLVVDLSTQRIVVPVLALRAEPSRWMKT